MTKIQLRLGSLEDSESSELVQEFNLRETVTVAHLIQEANINDILYYITENPLSLVLHQIQGVKVLPGEKFRYRLVCGKGTIVDSGDPFMLEIKPGMKNCTVYIYLAPVSEAQKT